MNAAAEDESIYNLLPRPEVAVSKPQMHRSQHPGSVGPKEFGGTKIRATATMGKPNGVNAEDPAAFLKKHAKEPVLPELEVILASPKKVPQDERLYVERPGFGKVPAYLSRNKQQIEVEKQQLEQYLKLREQPADQEAAVPMSEQERSDLLRHLKLKWAAVNA
eukprot:gene1566-1906_t